MNPLAQIAYGNTLMIVFASIAAVRVQKPTPPGRGWWYPLRNGAAGWGVMCWAGLWAVWEAILRIW